jgi:hypothetical protein
MVHVLSFQWPFGMSKLDPKQSSLRRVRSNNPKLASWRAALVAQRGRGRPVLVVFTHEKKWDFKKKIEKSANRQLIAELGLGCRSYLTGRNPQRVISSHAGQRQNRRLLRLPLVAPGRMRKDPRRKAERMLGVRLLQQQKIRPQRDAGEPSHGNINQASEI